MDTGELGPGDMLGSEVSGTHFVKMLVNYSLMECEVAHVFRLGRPAFRIIMPLISGL